MSAEDLARPAIVFAPHEDDETLGCGGTILRKRASGAQVTIAFLTDGRQSHAERLPREELVTRRRVEGLAAASALGVSGDDVCFLDFPDGELRAHHDAAVRRATALLCDRRPEQIFVTSRHDRTPDHVAACAIALAAAADVCADAVFFEYLVWFWAHWPWARSGPMVDRGLRRSARRSLRAAEVLLRGRLMRVPTRSVHAAKWRALQEHATQMRRPESDPQWPILGDVWGGGFLDCAFGDSELFIRR